MDLNAFPEFLDVGERNIEDTVDEVTGSEREESIQRTGTQRPVFRPSDECIYDNGYQVKRQRHSNRLPPDGWLDCPAFGRKIGCLIPSKVPLGEFFDESVSPGKRYSPRQVLNQLNIGFVIDLTNSYRYYNPNDWRKEGIKYVKIACKGRDSVPENEAVNTFVYEVSQFVARQKQQKPEKYVLVHCTHGHNRTGYMIVHYLMRSWGLSVSEAVEMFAGVRPPGIYKPDYIDALYDFYHETKPDAVVCPPTPEWKRSSDLDGRPDDDDGDDGKSVAPPVDESCGMTVAEDKMMNDDVLGDKIPSDQEMAFRQFCYHALNLPAGGVRGVHQFPGSHPVSLNRENLQLLRQRYYSATWKADGTRYMMLITKDGCYLIDRHFNFRRVQMRFPCRQNSNENGQADENISFHNFTLLDGEMIIDTVPGTPEQESQKQERRYLIYDMIAINQASIADRPFHERWKMLEKEVIEPRNTERLRIKNHSYENPYRYDLEPFRVRRKDFWMLYTVTKLLKEFIPKLPHEADGLVFQGWDDPYVPRTHEGLLKWKYASMNSVDFLFEESNDRQLLYLFQRGRKKLMEGNRVVFPEDGPDACSYSGKIIECSWDAEEKVWVCMRIRTDKGTPNEFNTFMKVMRSIRDNITEEVLLNEINQIIRLPMYADRMQTASKVPQHHNLSHRR